MMHINFMIFNKFGLSIHEKMYPTPIKKYIVKFFSWRKWRVK